MSFSLKPNKPQVNFLYFFLFWEIQPFFFQINHKLSVCSSNLFNFGLWLHFTCCSFLGKVKKNWKRQEHLQNMLKGFSRKKKYVGFRFSRDILRMDICHLIEVLRKDRCSILKVCWKWLHVSGLPTLITNTSLAVGTVYWYFKKDPESFAPFFCCYFPASGVIPHETFKMFIFLW